MNGRGEAERVRVGRRVMHAPVGNHDGAGHAIRRHVGKRRAERGEEPRAVGLAVRLPGLDHAHVEPGDAAQPFQHRGARLLGLPRALAEILARAFVDHDDRDGAQRVAVLAGERRIGKRECDEQQRHHADRAAAAARDDQEQRQHDGRGDCGPQYRERDEGSEGDAEIHVRPPTARAVRAAPARAPGRPCSCRSACT
jgi:hypothetical protein